VIALASAGEQNGHLPTWKLGFRTKYFGKTWSRHLNSDWFDSCNGSLFTGM